MSIRLDLRLELTIPADAYPACASPNGSLSWEFDVWSDERGVDTHERRMLVLLAPP